MTILINETQRVLERGITVREGRRRTQRRLTRSPTVTTWPHERDVARDEGKAFGNGEAGGKQRRSINHSARKTDGEAGGPSQARQEAR